MVWPIMPSLSGRDFAADFVKEIQDEADLVHLNILLCAWGLQHREAVTVGVQVKVIDTRPAVGEPGGRPEPRLVGAEGIAGSGVGNHHDLAVLSAIKKLLAIAGPLRVVAVVGAAGGNLPLASRTGERPD